MNKFQTYLEAARQKDYYGVASWAERLKKELKKAYPDKNFYICQDKFIRIRNSQDQESEERPKRKGTLVVDVQGTIGNSYEKAKEKAFAVMKNLK